MRVAICDDEREQCEYLECVLREYGANNGFEMHTDIFKSAESFLFEYQKNMFDILLLDIQMGGKNGMELAREIRKTDNGLVIIFITGISDFISEGYDVAALHYLLKPLDKKKLFECLDKVRLITGGDESYLFIQTEGDSLRIPESDAEYIEAVARGTSVCTVDKTYELTEPFGDFTANLPESFVRCHRSYAVNIRCIQQISKYEILLDSGRKIPVSRRLYSVVNDAFISFYRRVGE